MKKITAIIIAHNELENLKYCLTAIKEYSTEIEDIVVVDNASEDGTFAWLNTQKDIVFQKEL